MKQKQKHFVDTRLAKDDSDVDICKVRGVNMIKARQRRKKRNVL